MRIVVACGGVSGERDVSLRSGRAVADGLATFCDAVCVDVTSVRTFLENWPSYQADGVFIALHGGWGEDGRFQSALESWDIPYTGSRALGCMLAMDKGISRILFEKTGVPIAPGFALKKEERNQLNPAQLLSEWECVVVKPSCGGSTIGVTIAKSIAEIEEGLDLAFDLENSVVVEKFIPGSELTVAVFDGSEGTVALPPVEMRPLSGFYDYESKYAGGKTEYLCPAPLDEGTIANLKEYAIKAHKALNCAIYSRVDFRRDPSGALYALEVNTAPGMTATSLVPKAAAAHGWDFAELLRRIVRESFLV